MIKVNTDFKDIYNQYSILVYNVALNYLNNIEDAEEITQDVFVQVYDSLDKFNNNSSIKTWIYRITINKCLNFIKLKTRSKYFFMFGKTKSKELDMENVSDFEHPGILLENKENSKYLFGVINELPENQKTVFLLSKLDGISNIEIAEIMQISISSVESLMFRAKKSLKEKLSKTKPNTRKNY